MAQTRWNFPTGNNGDALTTANTGASSTPVVTGGTGSISTAQAVFGTRSALMTATSTSGLVCLARDFAATSALNTDVYVRVSVAPSGAVALLWVGTGSRMVSVELNTNRTITVKDSPFAAAWTSTYVIPLDTWVRVSLYVVQSSTVGQIRAAIYTSGSDFTTVVDDSTLLTNKNTGAAAYTSLRVGAKTATGTQTATLYVGSWSYDPAATGLPASYSANTAPTANAGPDQTKLPGTVCTLNGTGSTDPEGNSLTYLWTPPGGVTLSSNTTSSPTFTVPYSMTTQNYSIGLVVTDTGGLNSASDIVVISAAAHPEWYHNGTTWKAEIITNL